MSKKKRENKILRQPLSNRLVHWGTAASITLLIISGIGQLPVFKRYNIDKLPGGEWMSNYFNSLTLHYIGAIALLFIILYHMIVHLLRKEFDILPRRGDVKQSFLIIKAMITKGKEPESDKYLAEQRLAYVFIGGNVLLLAITGIIKMIKNLPGSTMSFEMIFWATLIHNIATVLLIIGIIAHLAAFVFKDNRKMLPGIFTGYVDKDYVKERHPLWYKRIVEEEREKKTS